MEERLYSPEQVAERLQMSSLTVMKWLRSGRLPGRKIGKFWRIKAADLEAFIDHPPAPVIPRRAPLPPED